jgi:hypothetical protein
MQNMQIVYLSFFGWALSNPPESQTENQSIVQNEIK